MSDGFGEHLRELRKKAWYTQTEMARRLGVDRSTYTYYETGKSQPNLKTLEKLCQILSVDYNTLLKQKEL